tara:strand:+ start:5039 stop:8860 length:3822 start_codon:yes stop_codon:yes gene_type:complete
MKVALSGMVLGASMIGANANALGRVDSKVYTFESKATLAFDPAAQTLTLDTTGATSPGTLECKPAEGTESMGNAHPSFETADLKTNGAANTALAEDYESGSVLTYYCGLKNGNSYEGGGSDQNPGLHSSNNRIRVDVHGTCTKEAEFKDTQTDTKVVDNYNNVDSPIMGNYAAQVTATVDFGCIQKVGFVPDASVALKFVQDTVGPRKDTIVDIVQISVNGVKRDLVAADVTKTKIDFTSSDNKVFTISDHDISFPLGTTRAHPDYYMSGGCTGTDDLCKGALEVTLTTFAPSRADDAGKDASNIQRSTSLVHANRFDPKRPQFVQCEQTPINVEKTYSLAAACYQGEPETLDVEGTLLEPLACPFNGELPDSTAASVAACIAAGSGDFINTCAGIAATISGDPHYIDVDENTILVKYTHELTSERPPAIPGEVSPGKYSFEFQFLNDPKDEPAMRFQSTTGLRKDLSGLTTTTLSADQRTFDYTINVANRAALADKASDFFVRAYIGNTYWSKEVTLADSIRVEGIPAIATSIELFGQVYTSCSKQPISLSKDWVLDQDTPLVETGRFEQLAPCSSRFEFVRDADSQGDLTVLEDVVGTDGKGIIAICKKSYESTDAHCQETGASDALLRAGNKTETKENSDKIIALITGACDDLRQGAYGGLVEFDEQFHAAAPVLCKGTCTNAIMHNLELDWTVDFKVSSVTGAANNKLVADQHLSKWEDPTTKSDDTSKYYTAKRFAYLIDPSKLDECGVNGVTATGEAALDILSEDTKTGGCLVHKQATLSNGTWGASTVDTGLDSATSVQDWLGGCGIFTETGARAKLVQRFTIDYDADYVDLNTTMSDESFCTVRDLDVSVETLVVDSSTAELTVSQISDPVAAERMSVNIENVGYSTEGCGEDQYRAFATVRSSHYSSDVTWVSDVLGKSTNGFYDNGFIDPNANGIIRWRTACSQVCGAAADSALLADWNDANGQQFGGTLSKPTTIASLGGNDEVTFSFNVKFTGNPCDEEAASTAGDAVLALYKVTPTQRDANYVCSSAVSNADMAFDPQADGAFCGRLTLTGMGAFNFSILDTVVTRQTPGSEPVYLCEQAGDTTNEKACDGIARGQLFTLGQKGRGDQVIESNNIFTLANEDAFSTIKYTVYWEMRLGARRRLLRSEHVFGAGDHESIASLVILPASAQIEDAVESLDASTEGEDAEDAEPVAPSPEAEDEGLSGAAIAGIIAGGVAVAGGIAYVAVQASGSGVSLSVGRPKKRDYSQVRRSERFSTMNF